MLDKPFKIRLFLKRPDKIIGFISDGSLIKEFKVRKFIKDGCPISDFKAECCEGFTNSQSELICASGFTSSTCLNPINSNLKSNVCCANKKDCLIPCGSMCCQVGQTCIISDVCRPPPIIIKGIPVPCVGSLCKVFNPFYFAQPILTCQNCSPRGTCTESSNTSVRCVEGTSCSGPPDFRCFPSGCSIE